MTHTPVIITRGAVTCTLYCGDCRDILPTLGKVDAVVTDPPYAVSVAGAAHKQSANKGTRNLDFFDGDDDWPAMRKAVCNRIGLAVDVLKDTGSLYAWCGHRSFGDLNDLMESRGFSTRPFIWVKECPVPSPPGAGWASGFELCLYAYRPGRTWALPNGLNPNIVHSDSYRFGQPGKVDHPTQKPEITMQKPIEASTIPSETVLDIYMGSGTTGVACLKTGRNFIGIECDPGYFQIAVDRIQREANQAVLDL